MPRQRSARSSGSVAKILSRSERRPSTSKTTSRPTSMATSVSGISGVEAHLRLVTCSGYRPASDVKARPLRSYLGFGLDFFVIWLSKSKTFGILLRSVVARSSSSSTTSLLTLSPLEHLLLLDIVHPDNRCSAPSRYSERVHPGFFRHQHRFSTLLRHPGPQSTTPPAPPGSPHHHSPRAP